MAAPQPRLSVAKEWDEATLALAKGGFSPADAVGYVATIVNSVTDLDVTITDVFPVQLETVTWELLDSDDMVVASGSGNVDEAYTLLADEVYTLTASGTIIEDTCQPFAFTNVLEVDSDPDEGECVHAEADSPTTIVGDPGELTFCLDSNYRYANVTNDALGALLVSQASAARLADLVNNGGSLEDLGGSGSVPGGPGDVVGPASAVDDRIATFDGTTGKLIQDSGTLVSDLGDVVGPGSSVDDRIATFDGATGKLLQDSGTLVSDLLTTANTVDDLTNIVSTTQAGTTYTLALVDAFSLVLFSNAALVTVTIPLNAAVAFDIGDRVVLQSTGAGGLTLSTSGITLNGSSPNTTVSQNEALWLEKTATDTWTVVGGTAA